MSQTPRYSRAALFIIAFGLTPTPGFAAATVTMSPHTASLAPGETLTFTAARAGTTRNATVIWSASCGSIDGRGVYTAPVSAATCTVKATLSGTKATDSANVTVVMPPSVTVGVIDVPAGGDLRAAIMSARSGDVIELAAGATYKGGITLPNHGGESYVTIRTKGPFDSRRITPTDLPRLATIVSPAAGVPVFSMEPGAHHWRLDSLAITQTAGQTYELLRLGAGDSTQSTLERVPHHVEVLRTYLFVSDAMTQRRAIGLHASDVQIKWNWIGNMKEAGSDSQGIAGWNTPGRIRIEDNQIEAAGENILFGGSDPSIPDLVPSDIDIVGNTLAKPLTWRQAKWSVKNLLELKNARRVTITANVMDGIWVAAQAGYAVLFTPRNQGGTCPWCTVEDVLFERNVLQHASSGVNILGTDDERVSQRVARITVRNNLLLISKATYAGDGRCLLVGRGPNDVTWDHNTCISDGSSPVYVYGGGSVLGERFVFTNNVLRHNSYGFFGDGVGTGKSALTMYFPGAVFAGNVLAGGQAYMYPAGNYMPTVTEMNAAFVDAPGGDYSIRAGLPYTGAGVAGVIAR